MEIALRREIVYKVLPKLTRNDEFHKSEMMIITWSTSMAALN